MWEHELHHNGRIGAKPSFKRISASLITVNEVSERRQTTLVIWVYLRKENWKRAKRRIGDLIKTKQLAIKFLAAKTNVELAANTKADLEANRSAEASWGWTNPRYLWRNQTRVTKLSLFPK